MNEVSWLTERGNAQAMLWRLRSMPKITRSRSGKRKLRLFACECCRLVWEQLPDPRLHEAVKVAERFAEGQASKEDLAAAHARAAPLQEDGYFPRDPGPLVRVAIDMAAATTYQGAFDAAFAMTTYQPPLPGYRPRTADGEAALCDLVRCIFGNPFRPIALNPAWLGWNDGTVRRLAGAIYERRRFGDMLVLADALEEAGCDNAEVLGHLRGPGPHVRGCWCVDLILLGKPGMHSRL